MKRNRKTSKHYSKVASNAKHFGAIIAILFVMVIVNYLANAGCQQRAKIIGDLQKEVNKLVQHREQESMLWEQMKTTEKLEVALRSNGMLMRAAHPNQNIYMKADGTPTQQSVLLSGINRVRAPMAKVDTRRTRRSMR